MNYQPHIKVSAKDISQYVLLPGDPGRVEVIGTFLSDFQIVGQNREFRIGKGNYQGIPITICSTGIGCPSTAIAVQELIDAGAKVLVRVGTCGGAWRDDIAEGSMVIPIAAIRDEGTTKEYIPEGFPAVADIDVVNALRASAQQQKIQAFVGINRTHDGFYGAQGSITRWGQYLLDEQWKTKDTPILCSEMECAALFVLATLSGVKAGAVLAVNATPEPLRERLYGRTQTVVTESDTGRTEQTVFNAIKIALDAIALMAGGKAS